MFCHLMRRPVSGQRRLAASVNFDELPVNLVNPWASAQLRRRILPIRDIQDKITH